MTHVIQTNFIYIVGQGLLSDWLFGPDLVALATCCKYMRAAVMVWPNKRVLVDEYFLDTNQFGRSLVKMSHCLPKMTVLKITAVAPRQVTNQTTFPRWLANLLPDFANLKTLCLYDVSLDTAHQLSHAITQWHFIANASAKKILFPVLENCSVSVKQYFPLSPQGHDYAPPLLAQQAPLLTSLRWYSSSNLAPNMFFNLRQLDIFCSTNFGTCILTSLATSAVAIETLVLRTMCGILVRETVNVSNLPSRLQSLSLHGFHLIRVNEALPFGLQKFWTDALLTEESYKHFELCHLPHSLTRLGLEFCSSLTDSLCRDLTNDNIVEWADSLPPSLLCTNVEKFSDRTIYINSTMLQRLKLVGATSPKAAYFVAPFICSTKRAIQNYLYNIRAAQDLLLAFIKSVLDCRRQSRDTLCAIVAACEKLHDNGGGLRDLSGVEKMSHILIKYKTRLCPAYKDFIWTDSDCHRGDWQCLNCIERVFGLSHKLLPGHPTMHLDAISQARRFFTRPISSESLRKYNNFGVDSGSGITRAYLESMNPTVNHGYVLSSLGPSIKMLKICLPEAVFTPALGAAIPSTVQSLHVWAHAIVNSCPDICSFLCNVPPTIKRVHIAQPLSMCLGFKLLAYITLSRLLRPKPKLLTRTKYVDSAGQSVFIFTYFVLVASVLGIFSCIAFVFI